MSFTEPSGPLTIAEVAARSGLSAHTLRYDADDRARPALLQRLRATGMPMPHMPRFAARATARRQGDCTIAARRALLERISEPDRDLAAVTDKITHYEHWETSHAHQHANH
jgi:DNA-binding transcriptional MerR regulator